VIGSITSTLSFSADDIKATGANTFLDFLATVPSVGLYNLTVALAPSAPFFVVILITPAIADEPYRTEPEFLIIYSMQNRNKLLIKGKIGQLTVRRTSSFNILVVMTLNVISNVIDYIYKVIVI
jgi:hypothetical protein